MPFSKKTEEQVFNRITEIVVEQGSIDRLLNTGYLTISLITFVNADSIEGSWSIPAIKNPSGRKKEIEESLLNHEGLLIKH